MLDKTLLEYLEKVRGMGPLPPEAEIRQALKVSGWNLAEIEESLNFLRAGKPVEPKPQPVPQPTGDFPKVAPITQPQIQAPIQPRFEPRVEPRFEPRIDFRPIEPVAKPTSIQQVPITTAPIQPLSAFRGMPSEAVAPEQPRPVVATHSDWPNPKIESVSGMAPKISNFVQPMQPESNLPPLSRPATTFQPAPSRGGGRWFLWTIIISLIITGGFFAFTYFAKVGFFATAPVEEVAPVSTAPENIPPVVIATSTPVTDSPMTIQRKNVGMIRGALSAFRTFAGSYPATLSDLGKVLPAILATSTPEATYWRGVYMDGPFLNSIPTDVFTNKDYGYSKVGDDYRLTYVADTVAGAGRAVLSDYLIRDSVSQPPKLLALYVFGNNTATSKVLSQEAVSSSKIDTDRDGVADGLEDFFGTDKARADSDGDGVSDYNEILASTNPIDETSLPTGDVPEGHR